LRFERCVIITSNTSSLKLSEISFLREIRDWQHT
jgi:hypothetical protein